MGADSLEPTKEATKEATGESTGVAVLARRAGVTVRTIRYYVAEGLLPPPGGTGQRRAYGPDHLLRLQAIKRLKARYLPLGEIRRLLDGLSTADLRRLVEAPEPEETALDPDFSSPLVRLPSAPEPSSAPRPPSFVAGLGAEPARLLVSGGAAVESPGRGESGQSVGQSQRAAPLGTIWRRVALAPGVELHYQLTGQRRRDAAVADLVAALTELAGRPGPLEALSAESEPHLGFAVRGSPAGRPTAPSGE